MQQFPPRASSDGEFVGTLGPNDWLTLDSAVARLFTSQELQPTLDAVGEVFVPQFADGIVLGLDEPRGGTAISAVRGAAGPGDLAGALLLPLCVAGKQIGQLRLIGPRSPGPLLERLAERCAQALHNARSFEHERRVALTFQTAALAVKLPDSRTFRFEAIYEAGRAEALVGGDWYDAFELADGRIVVSIGDVVGSGLGAAIAMVNVRQTIRVAQVHTDPAVMLRAADAELRAQHPDRYVTVFLGILDSVTQRCSYANAGHPPPLLRLGNGAVHALAGNGFPLGIGFEQQLEVYEIYIPNYSVLLLYTDGLTESTRDLLAGEAKLESLLQGVDLVGTANIADHLYSGMTDGHSRDDVAILLVRIELLPTVRRWRFDPRWKDVATRALSELRAHVSANGTPGDRMLEMEPTAMELFSNAIRYAPGIIELIAERRKGAWVIHMLDRGPGYSVSPHLPPDLFSQSGRGLYLISHYADEFVVERRPGRGSHARVSFTTA
jgi:anti-sigma regulatory factor (Ser/Thr protein kinase)